MNKTRSLKIYKPQDIEDLLNIKEYKLRSQNECESLILDIQNKCETLKNESYDTGLKKLHEEQLKLLETCKLKVDKFFKTSQEELHSILRVLFDKLNMDENSSKTLTSLLFSEVEKLKIKGNKFTLHANAQILPTLKEYVVAEYKMENEIFFDYEIKNELRLEECIVESEFVMARISVNDFKERVFHILTEKVAQF